MRTSARSGVVSVLLVAVVAAGCGDDDEPLTAAEFRSRANEICADGNAALEEAGTELFLKGDAATEDEIRAFFDDDVIPNVDRQLDAIADLRPPAALADEVEALLDEARAALDQVRDTAASDPQSLFAGEDPFADVNDDAAAIGLTACAEGGEADEEAIADVEPNPDDPYCAALREVDERFGEAFETTGDRREGLQRAAQSVVDDGVLADAPEPLSDDIRDDADAVAQAVEDAAGGDLVALFSGDASTAGERVDTYCGIQGDDG